MATELRLAQMDVDSARFDRWELSRQLEKFTMDADMMPATMRARYEQIATALGQACKAENAAIAEVKRIRNARRAARGLA